MIVIETSALIDSLVDQPANPRLLAVMADSELHAPALLDFEAASALRGLARCGKLASDRVADAVEDFTALQIERHQMTGMLTHILGLRNNFTAYDAAYVVLAQALAAPLVTSDTKLTAARRLGIDVQVFPAEGT